MISETIYSPFTYTVGWSTLDVWYKGSKYAMGCCTTDLWTKYYTSSPKVKEFRKEHGEPDIIRIDSVHQSAEEALLEEDRCLKSIPKEERIKWLNIRFENRSGALTPEELSIQTKKLRAERKDWGTIKGLTNEIRKEKGMSLITGRPKGSLDSEQGKKNRSVSKKGKRCAIFPDGTSMMIDKNDIRFTTGEIKGPNICSWSGKKHSDETKEILRQKKLGVAPWNKGLSGERFSEMTKKTAETRKKNGTNKETPGKINPKCSCLGCRKVTDSAGIRRWHQLCC